MSTDSKELLARQLEVVNQALGSWIATDDWQGAARRLLGEAISQTGSVYGFVGVVVKGPILRVLAWDGFSWDAVVNREFYDDTLRKSEESTYLDFPKLTNLFGWPILNGKSLLTNEPARDPRSSGIPAGHPPLDAYLGVPIMRGDVVVGTFGLANRAGGYGPEQQAMVETLARLATVFCVSYFAQVQRRQLETQLAHAQKMQAVGKLAGGVAHDFNNLMTVVLGYAQTLLADLDPINPHYEPVLEIHAAAERAAALTRQLLAYSRKQVLQPRVIDFNRVISSINGMLTRLIGENIRLTTILARDLWRIHADPSQLEQVVVNLVVNARDAMPDGGQITVETSNVTLDDEYQANHMPVTAGEYVLMSITDTGHGMDERTRQRIFEPFFTTKEVGKGTGLGLSTIHGIVNQSGGHVWVYSEPGRGSTFKIYLPRADQPREELALAPAAERTAGGGEVVLLAEDDDSVRRYARSTLIRLGYRVIEATDGEDALRLSKDPALHIGLLITDVVMPRMNGAELYKRLRRQWPGLKVLFISGYTENAIVHHGVLDAGVAFLPKPFSAPQLATRVRAVLES